MDYFETATASNIFGIAFLLAAGVVAFGVKRFCRRRGYGEEKAADVVFRAKVTAMVLGILGTVLVVEIIKF